MTVTLACKNYPGNYLELFSVCLQFIFICVFTGWVLHRHQHCKGYIATFQLYCSEGKPKALIFKAQSGT